MVDGCLLKDLSRLGGVLGVEGGYLLAGEVLEGHGLGDDVEGAGGAQRLAFGADTVFVVADVTQADEGDGVWEGDAGGAVNVAVAELCDEGNEDGFGEAVGFVGEEDEGAVEKAAVLGESAAEDVVMVVEVGVLEEHFPMWESKVEQGVIHGAEESEDAVPGFGDVAQGLEGAVEGVVFVAGVELSSELLYAGGFAGLAGGVDEEVLLAVDEALEFWQARGRGEDVVTAGVTGTDDVEEFSHGCGDLFSVSSFRDKDKTKQPHPSGVLLTVAVAHVPVTGILLTVAVTKGRAGTSPAPTPRPFPLCGYYIP
jgi:hypothetical protein